MPKALCGDGAGEMAAARYFMACCGALAQGMDGAMTVWQTYDHFLYAFVAVAGTALAAAGVQWLLTRSRWAGWIGTLGGVVPPFINIVGVLFGLTLAFLANDTWSAHDRAVNAVHREADALRGLKVLAAHLPSPHAGRVTALTDAYALGSGGEWALLAQRRADPVVTQRADALLSALADADLSQRADPTLRQLLLSKAGEVREQRELRVALSQTHVNPLKWMGMAFLGLLTLLSVAAVHIGHPRAAATALALFALSAAPTAAIVLVQGNPFQAPTSVSPAPILAVADVVG